MIVVTGATGNVGRPLVRALDAAGERVTAVSRSVSAGDVPAGVRSLRADLARAEDLGSVFDGAKALFLLTSGDFTGSGGSVTDVLGAARAAGISRVVLLSSQGVGTGRHPSAAEDAVTGSGLDWTLLRPSGFASNALQWAESVRTRRTVVAPFGDVALPVVDPADIAEAAATALRDAGHTGRTYELTGPAPVSPRQQTEAIAKALGEPVRFVEQSPQEARAAMLGFMPAPVVETTLALLGTPTPAERRAAPATGSPLLHPPRPFTAWLSRNTAPFT
ncbi:NAD(P)H-binding protein [Streptomyces uncialis]|uniref:NAD(P)H-binding protein n=1 Tax=Streptomyces uncialis TaxID=1048205 RepID=UPI003410FC55